MRRTILRTLAFAAGLATLAACDNDPIIVGPGPSDPPGEPRDLQLQYQWVLEGFDGTQSVGHPTVVLSWLPPADWDLEPFRVYGRRVGGGSFVRIATVTSCTGDGCTYVDRDVRSGEEYEYYVAAVNESTDEETPTDFREAVEVPSFSRPAAPRADSVTALDNALYIRWSELGDPDRISRYVVYLTRLDGDEYLYHMGETDGTAFVDVRAANGHRYGYRVAAVDTLGHVSSLSGEIVGAPRPDASGELVYAFGDLAAQSGFRFREDEGTNPIVAGSSPQAQWRLESTAAGWRIVPLNGTQVVEFPGRTTALACGPGADAGCRAATRAPTSGYTSSAIAVSPEFSYVFRVTGDDGQLHYGVIRAQILGSDGDGRDLMIFDWAYQLIPGELRLNRVGQ
jgi:hypothetical protein